MKKIAGFIFRTFLLTYVLLGVFAYFLSDQLMFPYQGSSYTDKLKGIEIIANPDYSEELAVLFRPNSSSKQVVLFFHGNAEDLGHLDQLAQIFNDKGYSFMSFDYRGYGLSTGKPGEQSNYQDAQFFFDYVKSKGFNNENIIIWGRSIGGGVATYLAEAHEVRLLVIESSFTSAFKVLTKITLFPFDRFNNLERMKNIKVPLLLLHGNDDEIIPAAHGLQLFDAHKGPKEKVVFKGAGHNNLWLIYQDLIMRTFSGFNNTIGY